jgi:hypothetical protein
MIRRENQIQRENSLYYTERKALKFTSVKLSNNLLGFSSWKKRATLVANLNPREQGRTRDHRGVQKIKKEKQCNRPTKAIRVFRNE